jgi:hypothetical protein
MPDKKPTLTLVKAPQSLQQYKDMINTLCLKLTGEKAEFTEKEWRENYKSYYEDTEKTAKKNP